MTKTHVTNVCWWHSNGQKNLCCREKNIQYEKEPGKKKDLNGVNCHHWLDGAPINILLHNSFLMDAFGQTGGEMPRGRLVVCPLLKG